CGRYAPGGTELSPSLLRGTAFRALNEVMARKAGGGAVMARKAGGEKAGGERSDGRKGGARSAGALPHQPLLRHARHEAAVLIDGPAREAPRAGGRRAVHRVEEPAVGAEGAMEPERVVEARHLHVRVEPREGVRAEGDLQQAVVRGVGEAGAVRRRVVREGIDGAEPDGVARRLRLGRERVDGVRGPELERA